MDVALRPFFRRKYLLTVPEKRFYNVLRGIVGCNKILAKVRLADWSKRMNVTSSGNQISIKSNPSTSIS
jgi:hypothetical protein